jgi:hypothetical protein
MSLPTTGPAASLIENAATIGTTVRTLAIVQPAYAFGDITIFVKTTGANMTEFYVDILPPGEAAATEASWVTMWSNTDFSATAEENIRKITTVGINAAQIGVWAVAWMRMAPSIGIRFRGTADADGTAALKVCFGR